MSICFLLDVCYITIWQYVQSAEMKNQVDCSCGSFADKKQ